MRPSKHVRKVASSETFQGFREVILCTLVACKFLFVFGLNPFTALALVKHCSRSIRDMELLDSQNNAGPLQWSFSGRMKELRREEGEGRKAGAEAPARSQSR